MFDKYRIITSAINLNRISPISCYWLGWIILHVDSELHFCDVIWYSEMFPTKTHILVVEWVKENQYLIQSLLIASNWPWICQWLTILYLILITQLPKLCIYCNSSCKWNAEILIHLRIVKLICMEIVNNSRHFECSLLH